MLTGTVPFKGQTVSDTLANILQTNPDWQSLPQNIPSNIRSLLSHCLEKNPRRWLRDIGDASIEISETLTDSGSTKAVSAAAPAAPKPAGLWRIMLFAVVCVLFGAIAATVISWILRRPISSSVFHFPIHLPKNQMLDVQQSEIAVSPDGKRLVYINVVGASRQIILKEFDQIKSKELPETTGALCPFFSPDSQSIGFQSAGKLKTLYLDGGKPKILCDIGLLVGASWGQDGMIYFCPAVNQGLWKISADGGVPEQVTSPEKEKGELGHWWPYVLPGEEAVLFTIWKTTLNDSSVAVLSLKTGQWRTLLIGASYARYAPTGHLLYAQSGTLMAVPFDLKQLKVGEPRRPVFEGLNENPGSGYAPFAFSREGLLYYVQGGEWLAQRQLVWVDRRLGVIGPLQLPPQAITEPCLSPDGRCVAFTKFDRGASNVWLYDLPAGPATQITFESSNFLPIWMPDSKKLTFTSYRAGPFDVYWIPSNRSSPEKQLITGPNDQMASSWSPDGKVLLFTEISPVTGYDIWYLSTEDSNTAHPLICDSGTEQNAAFSPDGNWIAFESDREGRFEVYVSPFPKPVPKKISTGGGYHPIWSADGKELFYRNGDKMIAVTIETEPELKIVKSEVLFEGKYYTSADRNYDVSSDGRRFLMVKESDDQPSASQLIVVHNWFEELNRLVPTQ